MPIGLHFITYGDGRYVESKRLIEMEARQSGWFESVQVHSPHTLPLDKKKSLSRYWTMPRGGGYWLWKPIIIQRRLAEIPEGDILLYADAGCVLNRLASKRLREYIELVRESPAGCLAFQTAFCEEQFTKAAVFDFCRVALDSPIRQSGQLVAGVQFYRRCKAADAILCDIMSVVDNAPHLFLDVGDAQKEQAAGFVESRHDQSIFSVVRKLHGATILPDETYSHDWVNAKNIPIQARRRRIANVSVWERAKVVGKRLMRAIGMRGIRG